MLSHNLVDVVIRSQAGQTLTVALIAAYESPRYLLIAIGYLFFGQPIHEYCQPTCTLL